MVTNKKLTLPHPNDSTLNFQKKNSQLLYPSKKKFQFSKKSTSLPPTKNKPPKSP